MGLFTQMRPEHNDELPGLPGEPLRHETAAERLPDAAPVDATVLVDGVTSISIPIPITPTLELAEPADGVVEADSGS